MSDKQIYNQKMQELLEQGVNLIAPATIYIADDIDTTKISPSVTIHPGCRISGNMTSIGPNTVLGEEAPVTIDNCQIADNCKLKGGYFNGSVIWSGVEFGSSAHVRPGTILEEGSSCAHSVGLKQTILMPYVTTGSLINFCDCLMSGGTSRKNHSEVGSSYIHFNFTPQQDKATASLIGDVARGIWLRSDPIFLGGQGGIVGPITVEYGTVIAAGTIARKNITTPNQISYGSEIESCTTDFDTNIYKSTDKKLTNCFLYLGNILALYQWNKHIRPLFTKGDIYLESCRAGAIRCLEIIIKERIKRLSELHPKFITSIELLNQHGNKEEKLNNQKLFIECWQIIQPQLENYKSYAGNIEQRDLLIKTINNHNKNYIESLQECSALTRQAGTAWLQSIVDEVASLWINQQTKDK